MRPWTTGSRPTPGTCRGGPRTARPGACWSAKSCSSRRRWSGSCRSGRSGCAAGRNPQIWPANPPGRPSGPGAGWDIPGAPCACMRPPSPSGTDHGGDRPRHLHRTPGPAGRGQLHGRGRRRLRLRTPRNGGGHQHPPGPRAAGLRLCPARAGPDRRRNAAGGMRCCRTTPAPRCAGTPPSWNSVPWSARRGPPSAASALSGSPAPGWRPASRRRRTRPRARPGTARTGRCAAP